MIALKGAIRDFLQSPNNNDNTNDRIETRNLRIFYNLLIRLIIQLIALKGANRDFVQSADKNDNTNDRIERRNSRFFCNLLIRMIIPMIALKGAIRDLFYNLLIKMIIPMIALKGANRDFSLLTVRVQITCNTSGAHHEQHVVCHVVRRGSSAIKFNEV